MVKRKKIPPKPRRPFSENLADEIARAGLTPAEVARRAGISPQNLQKYLRGDRCPVERAQTLIDRLAAAGLDPAALWPK